MDHIGLTLRISPVEGWIEGEARVRVSPTPVGMGVVRLDLDEVQVESVVLDDGADVAWRHDDGVLHVEGLRHTSTLVVSYRGHPKRGLYFVGPTKALPNREHQVWSQCQDEDGHFFFPCVDHPSLKCSFEIRIEAPEAYKTVSNGRLVKKEELEEGWTAWTWSQKEPIPAYLVNVIVAKLDSFEDAVGELPLNYLVAPGTPEAEVRRVFGRTAEMIRCFESRFGVKYPWARYDQIVVEDFILEAWKTSLLQR